MAMVLGTKTAAKLYLFEITFPFILVSICSIIGTLPLHTNIVLIALPTAIACAKTITNTTGNNNQPIADIDARTAQLQLQFSALLSIALILARFI
jgi:1,4-dihydroxy-2-naphthoate octaprenyltransferase